MQIIIPLGDLLPDLFHGVNLSDPDAVRDALVAYYTVDDVKPDVVVREGVAIVTVDTEAVEAYQRDLDRAAELASKGNYDAARSAFEKLLARHPTVSELHRMYAQVLLENGDGDAAIDPLIDALRWDPENVHALVLMGNIQYRVRRDFETAKRYYDRAAELAPDDYLTLSNLGAVMMELGRPKDAEHYFHKALEANADYPNTYYGIGLLKAHQGQYRQAFEFGVEVLRRVDDRGPLHAPALQLAMKAASEYAKAEDLAPVVDEYRAEVEAAVGKPVRMEERRDLSVRARIEVAENHGRDHHLLLYRPGDPTLPHLMMHELTHLDYIAEARRAGANRLYTSSRKEEQQFLVDFDSDLRALRKRGLSDAQAQEFLRKLFSGLNTQVFNAPIDLFIEGRLHRRFPALRPVQFASVASMLTEYAKQAADRDVQRITPRRVYEANVIYNLTHAFQLRDLYGLDIVGSFNASLRQLREAERLYDEYLEVQDDRRPGEEYSFVQDWAEDLKLGDYFELRDESAGVRRPPTFAEEAMDVIAADPLNLEAPERRNESNRLSMEGSGAGSMAVTMYLLDAIKLFEGKDREYVQQVAFEVAMLGNYGLDPRDSEQKYSLKSVPGKKFSALHLLAYMYAGFKVIDPTLDTELDFREEYERAKQMASRGM